jgi:hypothetical protein
MLRIAIASAFLLGAGAIAGNPATSIVGKALAPAPQSRVQAVADINDATAAALIGAISTQFGDRPVQVRLGQVQLTPAGIVQRDVHGSGQLQIGSDSSWIPFRFRALYDTEQGSVGSPELTLGGEPARALAHDGAVAKALGQEVARRLHQEFVQQATRIHLADVRFVPVGGGYLQIEADGIATFDGAPAATHVHALYDPRNGEWLQLAYELGPDGARRGAAVAAG